MSEKHFSESNRQSSAAPHLDKVTSHFVSHLEYKFDFCQNFCDNINEGKGKRKGKNNFPNPKETMKEVNNIFKLDYSIDSP